jgi:Tfp pilus assembly protein PilF
MLPISSHLIGLGCVAMIDGLSGKASAALTRLTAAYELHPPASTDEKMWVLLRLTELAQRRGQNDVAERRFKQALALGVSDTFLLANYADLLLDLHRHAEVVLLLKDKIRSDGLLLRLVMAQRSLNLPTAAELEAALGARYAAAQLRGDTVHQQEEARFMLHVKGNPQRALWLAQQNWLVQREPRDARIFLEAAIASKNFTAAQPVMQWLAESQIEDILLVSLGHQIRNAAQ